MNKLENILEKQEKLNSALAKNFKSNCINNFRLTSLGNSIASGYSLIRTIKPLLLRNETLEIIMNKNEIKVDIHHFARAQSNNDEQIFSWVTQNIKESEIHRLNRSDYNVSGEFCMQCPGITNKELEEYYPLYMENDLGLQDCILEDNKDMANIVVYNGLTGSFLDNITRHGKLNHKLAYGINRDATSLEATLKFIQANNRNNLSNTQVYICGVPDFLGIKITEIINSKLKKIAALYSNTVYVEPVKSKLFYEPLNSKETCKLHFDIHYDEYEYLIFINNIIKAMNDNYLIINSIISIDRYFYEFNSKIETEMVSMYSIVDYIDRIIGYYNFKDSENFNRKQFYIRLKKYLNNRSPYDFYCIGKGNINNCINKNYKKH
ncbi:MAG: hypothetical protein NC181_05235 [Clostridium sp.]|nr:hypothetical protein [Clostridium sp.]MCM1443960.1 hypothetical protein [Candidatus Amulumruptor caecigallinarius]